MYIDSVPNFLEDGLVAFLYATELPEPDTTSAATSSSSTIS